MYVYSCNAGERMVYSCNAGERMYINIFLLNKLREINKKYLQLSRFFTLLKFGSLFLVLLFFLCLCLCLLCLLCGIIIPHLFLLPLKRLDRFFRDDEFCDVVIQ